MVDKEPAGLVRRELVLGGSGLAGLYTPVSGAQAQDMLVTALAAGIRRIDTAPLYGMGLGEHRIGEYLHAHPDALAIVQLSTKVGRRLREAKPNDLPDAIWAHPLPFEPFFDYSYDGVMRSFESSCSRLGVERLHTIYVHDLDMRTHQSELTVHMNDLRRSGYNGLLALQEAGLVERIGIGLNEPEPALRLVKEFAFNEVMIAGRLTLLDNRSVRPLLHHCAEHDIAIVAAGVFNSGILADPDADLMRYDYRSAPPEIVARLGRLKDLCARHKVPVAAAALAFPLRFGPVRAIALGALSTGQLRQSLAWMEADISEEFWEELAAESRTAAPMAVSARAGT